MTNFYLPPVEKITVGIFEDSKGEIFEVGQWYPAIVFSYKDEITLKLIQLMVELKVKRDDLFLVNFEELKDRFNIIVCFKINRQKDKFILVAETEMDKRTVEDFKKYFQKTKRFIICFGFHRPNNVIALASQWYIEVDSYTQYDGKSVINYLCEIYH